MDYQKANSVSNTLLILSMVMFGGALLIQGWIVQMVCLVVGVGLIVAAIIMRVIYWRCPHCKKMLPLGFRSEPDRCPKCKEIIIKKDKQ